MVRWLGIVLLLGVIASCGRPGGGERGADRAPVWVEPVCPRDAGSPVGMDGERGGIPGDFVTAWVLR
jgi:hypothetical protein